MLGDAQLLSPTDIAAIGLIVLTIVQAAKLLRMPSEWSPVLAVALGGAIGIAAGMSNHLPWESWLSLFYEGAIGGVTGAGFYGVGKGMGELSTSRKRTHRSAPRKTTTTRKYKETTP